MFISEITEIKFYKDEDCYYIEALAEDCVLIRPQTYDDPPEYGPAKVCSYLKSDDLNEFITLYNLNQFVEDSTEIVSEYLDSVDYDLDWRIIEDDY